MSKRIVKRDDDSQDGVLARKYRKGTGPIDQVKVCQDLYEILRTQKTDGGRLLCQAFIRAPSRRNCPEYYNVVTTPIDLMKIHGKLKNEEYESVEELMNDIGIMVENAKAFYKKNQQEFKDAQDIWDLMSNTKTKLMDSEDGLGSSVGLAGHAVGDPVLPSRDPSPAPSNRSLRSRSPSVRSKDASPGRFTVGGSDPLDRTFLEELVASVVTFVDESGRNIAEPFKYLPSQQIYPEYYNLIRDPMDLRRVAEKLTQEAAYKSLNDVDKDLALMCRNAKAFNEPSSLIYKDAVALRKFITNKKSEIMESAITPIARPRARQNAEVLSGLMQQPGSASAVIPSPAELGEDAAESQAEIDVTNPLWRLYLAVRNYRDLQTSATIAEPFLKLPDKKHYPDYYDEIKNPMSFFMVKYKIRTGKYRTLNAMVKDLNQIFVNAKSYNIDGSPIHEAACLLQNVLNLRASDLESGRDIPFLLTLPSQARPVNLDVGMPIKTESPRASGANSKSSKSKRKSDVTATASNAASPAPPPAAAPIDVKGRTGRKSVEELMNRYRAKLMAVFNAINEYSEPSTNRLLSTAFQVKPSKKTYPDYYEVIPEPIDLKTIQTNINHDKYAHINDLVADIELMFKNARHYNEVGSQIYLDANTLERLMKERIRQIGPNLESPKGVPRSASKSGGTGSRGGATAAGRSGSANRGGAGKRGGSGTPKARQKMPDGRPMTEEEIMQAKLTELYETIRDDTDRTGRKLSLIFAKLPSKQDLPDYYDVIRKPIDMTKIAQKLAKNEYDGVESMVQDFCLMFDNACRYNDPESSIYKDSLALQRLLLNKKSELMQDEDGGVPDVQAAVQEMLTHIFINVYNHQDDVGRNYSDSLAELPELMKAREKDVKEEANDKPLSLDAIRRNLDRGRYMRLDRFQLDMFEVFEKAREVGRTDSQMFEDSCELQAHFIRTRDEMCKKGEHFLSPALAFTERHLTAQIEEDRAAKLPQEQQEDSQLPADPNSEPCPRKDTENDLPEVIVSGVTYRVGDFCRVKPTDGRTEPHIVHIERLWYDVSLRQSFINGNWYYRPHETFHLATRKFLEKEVFKSVFFDIVDVQRLIGKCHVMFVKDYFQFKPKGFNEEDIFPCESEYLGRVKHFRKLKFWPFDNEVLEERAVIIKPKRVPSVFVNQGGRASAEPTDRSSSSVGGRGTPGCGSATIKEETPDREGCAPGAEEDVDMDPEELMGSRILDRPRANVELKEPKDVDPGVEEGTVFYEQFNIGPCCLKLGDGVYVRINPAKEYPDIIRIDKIWKTPRGEMYLSGMWFARPNEIDHKPTRLFYKRELFVTSSEEKVPLAAVISKCAIMSYRDFCTFRPTEVYEDDVHLVVSRVRNSIGSMSEGGAGQLDRPSSTNSAAPTAQSDSTTDSMDVSVPPPQFAPPATPAQISASDAPLQHNGSMDGCGLSGATNSTVAPSIGADGGAPPLSIPSPAPSVPTSGGVGASLGGQSQMMLISPNAPGEGASGTYKIRQLKAYRLTAMVLDDEYYYFKKPIIPEKEASPLLAKLVGKDERFGHHEIDIDDLLANMDFTHDFQQYEDQLQELNFDDALTLSAQSWSHGREMINRGSRSKSGYILFSAEMRKKIMEENKDAGFGEISRLVGQEWRNLSKEQQKDYEERASKMAAERLKFESELGSVSGEVKHETAPPGHIRVWTCKWRDCDYMFDIGDQLYHHITGPGGHTTNINEVTEQQFNCMWTSCTKYRKEGKLFIRSFPSLPRLHRHIKDKHMTTAFRYIHPSQTSRNFVPYRPLQSNGSFDSAGSGVDSPAGNSMGGPMTGPPGQPNTPFSMGANHSPYPGTPTGMAVGGQQMAPEGSAMIMGHQHPGAPGTPGMLGGSQQMGVQQNLQQQLHQQQLAGAAGMMGAQQVQHSVGAGGQQFVQQGQQQTVQNQQVVYVGANATSQQQLSVQQPQQGVPGQQHGIIISSAAHGGGAGAQIVQQQQSVGGATTVSLLPGQQPMIVYQVQQQAVPGQAGGQVMTATLVPTSAAVGAQASGQQVAQHQQQVHQPAVQQGASAVQAPRMDPGRTIVQRPLEPVFIPPLQSQKVQRALHSKAYIQYIESLSQPQRTVSKYTNILGAKADRLLAGQTAPLRPADWFGHCPENKQEAINALWNLRQHLMTDSLQIAKMLDD